MLKQVNFVLSLCFRGRDHSDVYMEEDLEENETGSI